MSSSLAQRLSAARHSRFLGRADELKLFESAILPQRRDSTLLFENGSAEQGKGSPPKQANAKLRFSHPEAMPQAVLPHIATFF